LCCNDGHFAAGLGPDTPERNTGEAKRSGEGQAHIFLLREEWPERAGDKDGVSADVKMTRVAG
jgi:hypothetical protein